MLGHFCDVRTRALRNVAIYNMVGDLILKYNDEYHSKLSMAMTPTTW